MMVQTRTTAPTEAPTAARAMIVLRAIFIPEELIPWAVSAAALLEAAAEEPEVLVIVTTASEVGAVVVAWVGTDEELDEEDEDEEDEEDELLEEVDDEEEFVLAEAWVAEAEVVGELMLARLREGRPRPEDCPAVAVLVSLAEVTGVTDEGFGSSGSGAAPTTPTVGTTGEAPFCRFLIMRAWLLIWEASTDAKRTKRVARVKRSVSLVEVGIL